MHWYYAKSGQQMGPIERDALERLVSDGTVLPSDLVWNETMPNWQPARTMPEINGLIPTVLPPSAMGNAPYAPSGMAGNAPYVQHAQFSPPLGYAGPQTLQNGGFIDAKSYQGLAIGGFVCSLVGILCVGYLIGTVGVVLGWVALNGMKTSGNQNGRGLALAAVIIGICDVILHLGLFIVGMAISHHW